MPSTFYIFQIFQCSTTTGVERRNICMGGILHFELPQIDVRNSYRLAAPRMRIVIGTRSMPHIHL
jgi:hypothetical protein